MQQPDLESNDESAEDGGAEKAPTPPPLGPPRFTVRSLLLGMLLFGALMASYTSAGPLPTAILVLFALSVAAHVAGNAIGTRLRSHGAQPQDDKPVDVGKESPRPELTATNLAKQQSLHWTLWIGIGTGVAGGAIFGAVLLWFFIDPENATVEDTALGALAFGILGGMGSFLFYALSQVVFRAWAQASNEAETSSGSQSAECNGSSQVKVAPRDKPSL